MVVVMASSSAQISLGNLGITKFKDLTPENWSVIYKRGRVDELRWIVHLALFYREEVRHPEWYIAQVKSGESQLP